MTNKTSQPAELPVTAEPRNRENSLNKLFQFDKPNFI